MKSDKNEGRGHKVPDSVKKDKGEAIIPIRVYEMNLTVI